MGDQPRWPKGTPTGPTGPGGGRFRDVHGEAARGLAHPDNGRWVDRVIAGMVPSIYGTFTHPEFGDPTGQQQQEAERWAREQLEYPDWEAGVRSHVSSVEHLADGFSVNGRFLRGRADETVGTWTASIFNNDQGVPMATVDEINIDPAWQGRGIAGRWARRLEHAVRQAGGRTIEMWDQSGGFWQHMGYERDKRGWGMKQL